MSDGGLSIVAKDDLGDGRCRVFARTPGGYTIDLIIGLDQWGGADMWRMLRLAAVERDKIMNAVTSRRGGSEHDE